MTKIEEERLAEISCWKNSHTTGSKPILLLGPIDLGLANHDKL